MVYVNQVHPVKKGLKKNKKFLKLLYDNEELEKVSKYFDKVEPLGLRGEHDDKMTLDKFLRGMSNDCFIALQLYSPDPFDIRYHCSFHDSKNITRMVFVICGCTDKNFGIVSKLYKKAFGSKLEDEPVAKGLWEYYLERLRSGY